MSEGLKRRGRVADRCSARPACRRDGPAAGWRARPARARGGRRRVAGPRRPHRGRGRRAGVPAQLAGGSARPPGGSCRCDGAATGRSAEVPSRRGPPRGVCRRRRPGLAPRGGRAGRDRARRRSGCSSAPSGRDACSTSGAGRGRSSLAATERGWEAVGHGALGVGVGSGPGARRSTFGRRPSRTRRCEPASFRAVAMSRRDRAPGPSPARLSTCGRPARAGGRAVPDHARRGQPRSPEPWAAGGGRCCRCTSSTSRDGRSPAPRPARVLDPDRRHPPEDVLRPVLRRAGCGLRAGTGPGRGAPARARGRRRPRGVAGLP